MLARRIRSSLLPRNFTTAIPLVRATGIALAIATLVTVLATTSPVAAELKQAPVRSSEAAVDTQVQLIEVFTDTGQALIFNQHAREYELVRVGVRVRGWEVAAIGKRHLQLEDGRGQSVRLQAGRTLSSISSAKEPRAPKRNQPRDPYGATPNKVQTNKSLIDPYGPKVKAPAPEPPAKVKVVRAPAGSRAPLATSKTILTAVELDKALGDLEQVSRAIELRATPTGFEVTSIGKGSLPYRVGLRRGDIIRRVAGIRTARTEDGADVFLKLSQSRSFTVEISRDGVNASFDVVIKGR